MNPTDGYKTTSYGVPTKHILQSLSLKDSPELIKQYRKLHSESGIWPEITEGIRSVGILEMEIFIHGCNLVMLLEVPVDFDWAQAMTTLSTLPRQAEWEDTVAQFQNTTKGQSSSDKWHPMERIFRLYERVNDAASEQP